MYNYLSKCYGLYCTTNTFKYVYVHTENFVDSILGQHLSLHKKFGALKLFYRFVPLLDESYERVLTCIHTYTIDMIYDKTYVYVYELIPT